MLYTNPLACNINGGGLDNASQNDDVDLNSVMMESVRENENHRERVGEGIRLFTDSIKTKGWTIRGESPEDGNCLFWAVSDQLQFVDENHTQAALREMAATSMADYSQVKKLNSMNATILSHPKKGDMKPREKIKHTYIKQL